MGVESVIEAVHSKVVWDQVFIASIVSVLAAALARAPRMFFSFLNRRYWPLFGVWYRYAQGFTKTDGQYPIRTGKIFVFPVPFLGPRAYCKSDPWVYWGSLELLDGVLYVTWRGLGHRERMFAVFPEPLTVRKSTVVVGAKSCITADRQPAANTELLSKQPLTDAHVRALVANCAPLVLKAIGEAPPSGD